MAITAGAQQQRQIENGSPGDAGYPIPAMVEKHITRQPLPPPENAVDVLELTPDQAERANARRALKQASWAAIFFLITTDILGPFNAPYAISQVGYAPGVILYFFMGLIAFYTGCILAYLYCKLDSDKYPVLTYSDIGERVCGSAMRHICTVLQSVQLVVNVGTLILSNAQSLSQISMGKLCFVVGLVIWMAVGMFLGQIRSLKNYSWIANFAVWFNLLIIFTSMGFVANSPPNYAAAQAAYGDAIGSGPVITAAFVSQPLAPKVNGIMNMVFAYGGAMIFPELMSEMRRPMDFWKGMACAQLLIFVAYLLYGLFIYSFQGQYTLPLAYQGVSKYSWQTVGNVLAMITGLIAAGLYGNIGIKVAYHNIVEGWFNGPPIMSKKGRYVWSVMVIVYWALAFVIGAAIPQIQTISGLIAAVCIMQFSYTFPPLFLFMFLVRRDTLLAGGSWKVGLWGRGWFLKWFNFTLFLGALSMAALGMYGSGISIRTTFMTAQATSFGCVPPV
uniref:Oligopeptide transporter protein n=1 Tax=uncultured eukaryote TaxID=100272 RepID=G4U3G7_9EUKA|nr:oligopeptide transporter protein [uncultured eukaryote]